MPPKTPPEHQRGWCDHPILSVLLGLSWLALSQSLAPVHVLSAVLIGVIVPRLVGPLLPAAAEAVHWPTVWRLTLVVLWDIVISNIAVARLVLGPMSALKPAWLKVPLDSTHPRVNALFASIITTTPGTVSAVIDEQQGVIWVHALNCDDAAGMVSDMKQRYEAPLLRAFNLDARSPRERS